MHDSRRLLQRSPSHHGRRPCCAQRHIARRPASIIDNDAFQCGFCTPGQIISAVACIREGHTQSADEIAEWMSGNICRCSAYPQIVAAVDQAAKRRNNADIPRDIDVFFIEEHDDHASKIGARGIGELGVAAAIENAIYHATGKRVRKLPVHIVDLIAHKPVSSGYRA